MEGVGCGARRDPLHKSTGPSRCALLSPPHRIPIPYFSSTLRSFFFSISFSFALFLPLLSLSFQIALSPSFSPRSHPSFSLLNSLVALFLPVTFQSLFSSFDTKFHHSFPFHKFPVTLSSLLLPFRRLHTTSPSIPVLPQVPNRPFSLFTFPI